MKNERNKNLLGPILIIVAGCFWGSMGIFVRKLGEYGFSSIQIVSIRLTLAAIIFALILLIKTPSGFKILPKDIPLFLGMGFGSILFFTVCYFFAIKIMSLSTAAILLYTSPVWIMLMSVILFKENFRLPQPKPKPLLRDLSNSIDLYFIIKLSPQQNAYSSFSKPLSHIIMESSS